ncbi:MAG: hypothetical protein OEO19_18420 [Gammaproteobacteria bacterium]|nr:hypothetical protein [Gammaproteobacteria bacterium]MDH3447712.1 hypothetical protein [Gammaproteobacteria bacterium]
MKNNASRGLRNLALTCLYLLGFLGILASGGGDDEDEFDDLIISSIYSFRIGGPLEGGAGNSVIDIDRPGEFSLSTEPDLQGTVICDQNTEICELQTVDVGSMFITDLTVPAFLGNVNILVEDMWIYNPIGSDRPNTGVIRIDPQADGLADILVGVTDCDANSPGAEVQVIAVPALPNDCYSWDEFENLADNPGSSLVELQASFSWAAVSFIVDQGLDAGEVFPFIVDDLFAGGTSIFDSCEMFSGTWAGGPAVNPGGFTFDWLDDSGDNRVGPGDSFRQTFADCWFGDSIDGTLLNGGIDYVGYTQVIQNELLTRLGFEIAAPGSGKIGGVSFDSLVLTETIKANDIITTEPPLTLTGRYLIVFF